MRWRTLLTSPTTTTCWSLDADVVTTLRRDGQEPMVCIQGALGDGTVEVGPVGLQTVDRELLRDALAPVQEQQDGARRAALVIPTAWIRSHLLDFDELPRKQLELDEVVRWRLKKLLPVLPSELRVSVLPYPAVDGRRQLLCLAGIERAFASLEQAFADINVELGIITPRLFALVTGDHDPSATRLVVQQEADFLSLLLVAGRSPQLLRTKPLPRGEDPGPVAIRELHMALAYIRDSLAVTDPLEVVVSAHLPEIQGALTAWWAEQPDVSVRSPALPELAEPEAAFELGSARLAPMYAVLAGDAAA